MKLFISPNIIVPINNPQSYKEVIYRTQIQCPELSNKSARLQSRGYTAQWENVLNLSRHPALGIIQLIDLSQATEVV